MPESLMTTTVIQQVEYPVELTEDIVKIRQEVKKLAQDLNFSLVDLTKLITAASELARNMFLYAGGGMTTMEVIAENRKIGIKLLFTDKGPGISDLNLALTDGYSTSGGMGLGLGGSRRLVNEFDIRTGPEGTTVSIIRWR